MIYNETTKNERELCINDILIIKYIHYFCKSRAV